MVTKVNSLKQQQIIVIIILLYVLTYKNIVVKSAECGDVMRGGCVFVIDNMIDWVAEYSIQK